MMRYSEINDIENRMLVDSEWDDYREYREPCEWDLFDDEDLFEEDMIDDFE